MGHPARVKDLFVGGVVFFDEGDGADDVVGDGRASGELEGGAHGGALPGGADADGMRGGGLRPGGDDLLDEGLVGAELGDDGDYAGFGGGGDAAVGGVVAEPDDVGDLGVVVGEVEGGDVAGGAVDHEPGAGLPGPAGGFVGQGVVDVEGAADDEGAVGDVVDVAEGPFFLVAVDVQGANAEGSGVLGFVVGGGFGRGVGDFARGAEGDGVDLWGLGGGGGDRAGEKEKQGHKSRTEGLHGRRVAERGDRRGSKMGGIGVDLQMVRVPSAVFSCLLGLPGGERGDYQKPTKQV
jgi:hypothetical protein